MNRRTLFETRGQLIKKNWIRRKKLFSLHYTLNRVKLERAVTFMKYLASLATLIFLPKTLIWNKITFPASNSLNFVELVENELMKSISKKFNQYSFFYTIYRCLL